MSDTVVTTIAITLAGLIPFAYELSKEDETNLVGIVLLSAIALSVGIYFTYTFFWSKLKRYIFLIEQGNKRINELERSLKYKDDFYQLEKRLSLVEMRMGKKGQVDPKWVFLTIIILLLILYLKSQGVV